ncbi:MAG: Fe-S cluster assembly protein SufB [Euryarchaeota archaeon]|nr:Fe-S cluster assembly protein SufB [Euryarchaeota archaeon]MDE1836182.1 Fe-S cluster assembly protein SufB [Euryarchaeota archaeon]MDE1881868.1 Fe-S cluster assembly protein SufB [Euryarchaeota archaeon]MDE2045455.1 Fe-S cluster assembly protein SufB [Thermoplasmata archaeon]
MAQNAAEITPLDYTRYDFKDPETYKVRTAKGLSRDIIRQISDLKHEPSWMLEYRLRAYEHFLQRPMPDWGPDLSDLDFDAYTYYANPLAEGDTKKRWEDLPPDIKNTFDRLGIPKAEREYFAGVGAQYDSGTVYHKIRDDLAKKGVIFCDTDTAVREHPDILRKYFGKIVPYNDNKFSALNSAVWSGGSFVYIPPGVDAGIPLQAYFRINAKSVGQFERTLIIADKGAKVHYIEGCTAPVYSENSLHAAVVEVIAEADAKIRYTTVQNWSKNVYNLVTKRAHAFENSLVEWVDGNLGSKVTMKYPSVYLKGRGARGDMLSVAFASEGQIIDSGAKAVHSAPETSSKIIGKSIAIRGGRTSYRGLLHVARGATGSKSAVRCDALLPDAISRSDTYPYNEVHEYEDVTITHEAVVGKIGEEQIFYLMSRGLNESDAIHLILMGFLAEFAKELPVDYALELNRLIQLEMTGAVG